MNDTEKNIIIRNITNDSIWIKTTQDAFVQSKDIVTFEESIEFNYDEIKQMAKVLHMPFEDIKEKLLNKEFTQFGSLEDFLKENLSTLSIDEIIENMTDLFLPVCLSKSLKIEEQIQSEFDNVVMLNTSNIVKIL